MPIGEYIRSGIDRLYICPFDVDHLRSLPWRTQLFDVFLIDLENCDSDENTRSAISELVKLNNDWVETFGVSAERLHDEIDQASVGCGRQSFVGDGSPMTAWHDDLMSISEIADYIKRGGHGSCEYKLVTIIGASHLGPFIDAMKERLPHRIGIVG